MSVDGQGTVAVERDDDVVVLTLQRPGQANALDSATVRDLRAAVADVAADESVAAVLVCGAGKHFCAGMDLKEVDRPTTWFEDTRGLFDEVAALPVPTIAALHGGSLGGGAELALSCDLRIGDTTTSVGFPEIRIGALPVAGGTQRLTRVVGRADAKLLLWTGEPVDAETAHRLGLIQELVPKGAADERGFALAHLVAGRAPVAVRMAKRLVDDAGQLGLAAGLARELEEARVLFADLATRVEKARESDPMYGRIVGEGHASSSIRDTGFTE
jgi:enoyl-CoA hydratase